MSTEGLIRVTVLVNRRPGMSEDEFNRYWAYEHGPLATDWLRRSGIVRYVQYHTTSEHKALGKKMFEATGRSPLSYDGMGDFWVRKYEDFEAAFLDPYYQKVIQPDEKKLICMDTISVTIGVEYVVIDDGEIVQAHARSF
ncbi:uncharacterized protein N0V89_007264 [Didymosphaeria variabile]|uniref:EthD domain-containing protein n=1 Tax=Didymosphaeria variabile TaxID=1932322 RepID=A0A9W8XL69_9PLEO|nr:uncharacterized protein N0V89_007264 [Didymosphaeria variabile]KAJ4351920.1 hypothetical protein N0V89_007264 [Didymosphaeria variabile]